jgi:hypothetical protein
VVRGADPARIAPRLALIFLVAATIPQTAAARPEDAPIFYSKTPAHDPVARLQRKIDSGAIKFDRDPEHGYLEAALKHLNVPASSQMLVLSKTSFQSTIITPRKPRALYFNDETYIGYVQGGTVLEIISIDRNLGSVFYLMSQNARKPKFVRQNFECMQCHLSDNTQNVPGLLMRSVYADLEGQPNQSAGSFITNDHSPFSERWGGWYVTGKYGSQRHMGNMTCDDAGHPDLAESEKNANIPSVAQLFKTEPYLRDTSDVVALMVLGHQQSLHNLMESTNYYVRTALYEARQGNKAGPQPASQPSSNLPQSTRDRIDFACERVVKALLFSGETRLTDPVAGTSGFAEEFSARGPKDRLGRSLRDFDLTHRLFKYPCSYLIYSEQFDGLPAEAKERIYRRMWEVLSGKDDGKPFEHLTAEDRGAILQILRETKKDLPGYWNQ